MLKLFSYMKYAPLLEKALTDIEGILSNLTSSPNKIPSPDQIKLVLDDVRQLLDSGLIKIPNVDDKTLSDEILKIEEILTGASVQALSNLIRFGTATPSTASQLVPQAAAAAATTAETDAAALLAAFKPAAGV